MHLSNIHRRAGWLSRLAGCAVLSALAAVVLMASSASAMPCADCPGPEPGPGTGSNHAVLNPGYSANFPTWAISRTTIRVVNTTSSNGTVRFAAFGSPLQDFAVPAHQTIFVTRSWVGFNVNVKNISSTAVMYVDSPGGP